MSEIKTNKLRPRKGTTQTIGDSGDTISISCGVTTTNAGTISTGGITGGTIDNQGTITGLQQVIDWDTTPKTSAFTAESNRGYFVDTTSAAITVTFPASPTAGDVIAIKDYALTANTNNITIDPNGNKIQGKALDFDITVEGTAANFIYVDSTRGWVLTDASKASDIAGVVSFTAATGGTITTCGDFKIHTFTGPGTFCVSSIGNAPANPLGGPDAVDYLVVAGGAGGFGAGGGAGGFRLGAVSPPAPCLAASGLPISVTAYPITVGAGGTGGPGPLVPETRKGSDSVFSTITSTGGGGDSSPGGSGGGGNNVCYPAGTGNTPPVSPPQGNPGGTSTSFPYGGGGGASAAGFNGSPFTPPSFGGPGGTGAPVTAVFGASPKPFYGPTNGVYSGGGGGGGGTTGSTGGPGGGGNGVRTGVPAQAGSGVANTGGGGGGNYGTGNGGDGGSGIVIIRYKFQ